MSVLKQLDGPLFPPKSGTAKQMVVFLHGYGANGADLLSIAPQWATALPDAVFLAPNAPVVCEQFAAGFQWFSIRAIETAIFEREKSVEQSSPILNAYIDEQLKRWNVDESRLAVVGFSQGAMMAMYVMPRRKKACAGVVAYSGMLIDPEGLKSPGIVKVSVLAIHGDADDIVPPAALKGVQAGFSAAGFNVETIMRVDLGHGIDQFGLTRALQFIKEAFEK